MRYQLTYIYHDCFLLQTPDATVLFDYFADSAEMAGDKKKQRKKKNDIPGFLHHLSPETNLYIVVSHHHKDHFTSSIFHWCKRFVKIKYIISEDVGKFPFSFCKAVGKGNNGEASGHINGEVYILRPGEEYSDSRLRIKAFDSTDIGNSYLLAISDTNFFHAGDLNLWEWEDDTPEESASAREAYMRIVNQISQECGNMELCMFPVDSRLGGDYAAGARIFLQKLKIHRFVPMHFCLADNHANMDLRRRDAFRIENYARNTESEIICLGCTGDCFSAATNLAEE